MNRLHNLELPSRVCVTCPLFRTVITSNIQEASAAEEKVGFTKKILKKGKTHMKPDKGSVVSVWYTG